LNTRGSGGGGGGGGDLHNHNTNVDTNLVELDDGKLKAGTFTKGFAGLKGRE
jgi:hypothetical protein